MKRNPLRSPHLSAVALREGGFFDLRVLIASVFHLVGVYFWGFFDVN
jgi:hypothetical protein